jgi:tRNA A37 methylthiotransferase MiaB
MLGLARKLAFQWAVVFIYDAKEGMPAAGMNGRIPDDARKSRLAESIQYLKENGIRSFTKCPWEPPQVPFQRESGFVL